MNDLKLYKCHKTVHAKPMNNIEAYNTCVTSKIPEDESSALEGYLVVYNKGTPDHYESWSPKKQFDDGYSQIVSPVPLSTIVGDS